MLEWKGSTVHLLQDYLKRLAIVCRYRHVTVTQHFPSNTCRLYPFESTNIDWETPTAAAYLMAEFPSTDTSVGCGRISDDDPVL